MTNIYEINTKITLFNLIIIDKTTSLYYKIDIKDYFSK